MIESGSDCECNKYNIVKINYTIIIMIDLMILVD